VAGIVLWIGFKNKKKSDAVIILSPKSILYLRIKAE